jgi:hypothetical protein
MMNEAFADQFPAAAGTKEMLTNPAPRSKWLVSSLCGFRPNFSVLYVFHKRHKNDA